MFTVLKRVLIACAVTVAVTATPSIGQDDEQKAPETRVTGKLSRPVYEKISLAQEAMEKGNPKKALSILNQLKQRAGELSGYERAQMYRFFASVFYEMGDVPATIEAYKNLLRQEDAPQQLRNSAIYRLAQLYLVQEDYETAIKLINVWKQRVQSITPAAYSIMARAHYRVGDYDAAKSAALKGLREAKQRGQPIQENWLSLLRAVYYKEEDYQKAARLLELLVRKYPKTSYYKQLAGMYGLLGQEEKRLYVMHAAYAAGLLTRPSSILNTARLYMAQGAPYPAVRMLKDAMGNGKVEPNAENLQLLGQAMALAKAYEGQIPVLKKAAALSGSAKQYLYLAQAQAAQYDWEAATSSFRKALNIGGLDNEGLIYMQLGNAYFNSDNTQAALNAFQQAARYAGTAERAQQWIKFVNQEIKRQKAIEQYES